MREKLAPLTLAALLSLSMALTACGSSAQPADTNPSPEETAAQEQAEADTQEEATQEREWTDEELTAALEVEEYDNEYFGEGNLFRWVGKYLVVTNGSPEVVDILCTMRPVDASGNLVGYESEDHLLPENFFAIAPGEQVVIPYSYEEMSMGSADVPVGTIDHIEYTLEARAEGNGFIPVDTRDVDVELAGPDSAGILEATVTNNSDADIDTAHLVFVLRDGDKIVDAVDGGSARDEDWNSTIPVGGTATASIYGFVMRDDGTYSANDVEVICHAYSDPTATE